MADELDLDLPDEGQENINKVEKRIKDLSEKVKLTSQERDELTKAKDVLEQEKTSLVKERDFFKNFSTQTSKYPGAAEYQDKILEKVNAGYEIEDATISILAKEGKLTTPPAPKENPAGGSAITSMSGGEKSFAEMTKEEKRQALIDSGF